MQGFLAKHQITQVTQLLYSPYGTPCDFCPFLKLKSPSKGKRFQTINEIQENMTGWLMVIRIVWGPRVPTLKGTEVSLFYVQCFLYPVSSSINVSIFHSSWLDTFWTDHIHSLIIFDVVIAFSYEFIDLLHCPSFKNYIILQKNNSNNSLPLTLSM